MGAEQLLLPPPADRLETLPIGYPELTLGEEAAAWAHDWLIQPNGPRVGKPFRLTYDQYRFLLWWYAVDELGNWIFRHAVRRLAKGSGKSPFAAALALIEFLAPVRLHDFDERAPGGCVGRPVDMPWVQIVATAESQTANTMRMVRAFAPKTSELVSHYNIDAGKVQYYRVPEGTLEVKTSSSGAAEGAEATCVVADETELWIPSKGGPELAATLEDNLAKSGNRMLETCNAWVPGIGSVAEDSWDAWVLQEEGRTRGTQSVLYDARIAPPDTDMADAESLRAALEHVYEDCDWKRPHDRFGQPILDEPVEVDSIMARIWDPTARPSESKRKYLNWPTIKADAWVDPAMWRLLHDPDRLPIDGEQIALGFDGSKSQDATALLGCCITDGHTFPIGIWEIEEDDQEIDANDVDVAVGKAFRRYDVVSFFADVREWESFTKISWPKEHGASLQTMAIPAGKSPQQIAWDMRSNTRDFTMECELVLAEIMGEEFTWGSGDTRLDSALGRHVANSRAKANQWGESVGKESPDSPLKIDANVAMIIARLARRRFLTAPTTKKKQPSRVRGIGRR